jgi:RNA polymerase sigma-70 factor (ECF subfamily)
MDVSDHEWMDRLAKGEDLALNELMDRWSERVTSFLYRMIGQRDTAIDLAQETFVKLYQARERYRPMGSFSSYLFAIASNLAKNYVRWIAKHPTVSMDAPQTDGSDWAAELVDPVRSPDTSAEVAEKMRAVNAVFLQLPTDLKEAMSLYIYEGLSYTEIAAIAECTPKAIETRIYRARQILRERLQEFTE